MSKIYASIFLSMMPGMIPGEKTIFYIYYTSYTCIYNLIYLKFTNMRKKIILLRGVSLFALFLHFQNPSQILNILH